jgi:hypothetical protein
MHPAITFKRPNLFVSCLIIGLAAIIFLLYAVTPASSAGPEVQAWQAAAGSGIEIGAFVGVSPPSLLAIKGFETSSKRHIRSVMWYQGWSAANQPAFPLAQLKTAVRYHDVYDTQTILHLTWEPQVVLKAVSSGTYDSYLIKYAREVKSWGGPVRLRYAHEMIQNDDGYGNGDWYLWQDQPAAYVAAFRHVHDVFTAAGASNVEFVWCPNNYPFNVDIVKKYYPGPGYVDWLCMDGYNWTDKDGKPGWPEWQWFDDIYYNIYHTFVDHTDIFGVKPIMIGEFGSCEASVFDNPGQTKAAWITNTFARLRSADYTQIKAFYWFNIKKECDWRINSSPASLAAFQTAMVNPIFVSHPLQKLRSLTSLSLAVEDGWVLESGENSNTGLAKNNIAALLLGDDAAKKQYRSILSFSTMLLPDNATITGVTLKLKKQAIAGGGNPIDIFQGLIADVQPGLFGNTALESSDFQAKAAFSSSPLKPVLVNGWYSLNLISAKNQINKLTSGSGRTQIRLRFKLDDNNNSIANSLSFYSGNTTLASNRPSLIITYYSP